MQCTTPHRKKGQHMGEPQETRQEQETRWAAQRAARNTEFQAEQHARHQRNRRIWLLVGAIVIIVAVIAATILL